MTDEPENPALRSGRHRWRTALGLGGFAVAVRLAVLGVTLWIGPAAGPGTAAGSDTAAGSETAAGPGAAAEPGVAAGVGADAWSGSGSGVGAVGRDALGLDDLARLHDGREYLALARSLGSPQTMAELPPVVQRLGPGYPLLIRGTSVVLPAPLAALALALVGAGLATALVHRLGVGARGTALFAVLTPSWVTFSSTAMSEGPFVALALLGLLAWSGGRRRDGIAGLLFGAAALVRPVGAVLFAALWLLRLGRDLRPAPPRAQAPPAGGEPASGDSGTAAAPAASQRTGAGDGEGPGPASEPGPEPGPGAGRRSAALRRAAVAAAAFPVAPVLGLLVSSDGPVTQLRTYVRHDLASPLASLWAGFSAPLADPLKTAQNLAVLALVVVAAGLLLRRRRRHPGGAAEVWLAWLGSQTLFYLLLPSAWVFECLARFLVPALPAVAAALAPRLPGCRWRFGLLLVAVTVLSAGVSLFWNLRALGVLG